MWRHARNERRTDADACGDRAAACRHRLHGAADSSRALPRVAVRQLGLTRVNHVWSLASPGHLGPLLPFARPQSESRGDLPRAQRLGLRCSSPATT